MTSTQEDSVDAKGTVLSALLILFFLQLVTMWIESIFRITLTELVPGQEMLGLLLMLFPVMLLFSGKKGQRLLCGMSVLALLAARALCPFFGARGLIVVAGIGVGISLAILCFMLAGVFRFRRDSMGLGLGIAVLLSVVLRAWGSSFDISMGRQGALLIWVSVVLVAFLLRGASQVHSDDASPIPMPFLGRVSRILVFFSSLTIAYLVLMSPAVVTGWSGSNYLVGTSLLIVSFVCALGWYATGMPGPITLSRGLLLFWNLAFIASLIWGIKLHTIVFPSSPASPTVVVEPTSWMHQSSKEAQAERRCSDHHPPLSPIACCR